MSEVDPPLPQIAPFPELSKAAITPNPPSHPSNTTSDPVSAPLQSQPSPLDPAPPSSSAVRAAVSDSSPPCALNSEQFPLPSSSSSSSKEEWQPTSPSFSFDAQGGSAWADDHEPGHTHPPVFSPPKRKKPGKKSNPSQVTPISGLGPVTRKKSGPKSSTPLQ